MINFKKGLAALAVIAAVGAAASPSYAQAGGVRISAQRAQALHECSVIMAPYHAGERLIGWVGVLGPTRMHYPQVAPAVDLAARSLTEAFARIGLAP